MEYWSNEADKWESGGQSLFHIPPSLHRSGTPPHKECLT